MAAQAEAQGRLDTELRRLLAQAEAQRRVDAACLQLTNDVLTLQCPRCRHAVSFEEYDYTENCMDVSCAHCPAHFCGWCFKDCGDDAHRHAAHCRYCCHALLCCGPLCSRSRRASAVAGENGCAAPYALRQTASACLRSCLAASTRRRSGTCSPPSRRTNVRSTRCATG